MQQVLVRKSSTFWKVNPGLGYKKNLVGQAYDGASVTSGKHSGGPGKNQKEEAKYELHIHCSSNSLNLFLVDIAKAVPEAEEFSPREKPYVRVHIWINRSS